MNKHPRAFVGFGTRGHAQSWLWRGTAITKPEKWFTVDIRGNAL
jgi:hypothetical protein